MRKSHESLWLSAVAAILFFPHNSIGDDAKNKLKIYILEIQRKKNKIKWNSWLRRYWYYDQSD